MDEVKEGLNKRDGMKFDGDKLDWSLLPIEPIESVVEVMSYGAKKYAKNNWQKLDNFKDRYYSAAMRHLASWRKGEIIDDVNKGGSGLRHLQHALTNLIFLEWNEQQELKEQNNEPW